MVYVIGCDSFAKTVILSTFMLCVCFRLWLTRVANLLGMRNSHGKTWEEKQLHW